MNDQRFRAAGRETITTVRKIWDFYAINLKLKNFMSIVLFA
jgi:hypothetical protein